MRLSYTRRTLLGAALLATLIVLLGATDIAVHSSALYGYIQPITEPGNSAYTESGDARSAVNPSLGLRGFDPAPKPYPKIVPEITTATTVNGMVPVFLKIETRKPVVFLTIDDGDVKDPAAISFMRRQHLVASLFLNDSKVSGSYDYFKALRTSGSAIENHTINHYQLTKLSYDQQKQEICGNADRFRTAFGTRPTFFRPPYGAYNDITRRAAADCGMTALIQWHAKANGGSMQYQEGDKLLPGDIVLMHFRKEVIADLTAFNKAARDAHLQPVLLEDWLK